MVPESCAKEFDKSSQWKCVFPSYRFKYVKTPFVLIADQYDDYFLNLNLKYNSWKPMDKDQIEYALDLAKLT